MKKIAHYAFYLIELLVVFFLYTMLQEFYFYPNIFGFGRFRAFVLALYTVLVFWFGFMIYNQQLKDKNNWGFSESFHLNWRNVLIALVGFFIMRILYGIIMTAIGGGISQNQADLNNIQITAGPTYQILTVIVGPICEELIFRGYLFNILFSNKSSLSKWAGIIVSGFFFGYAHDPSFSPFLYVYWMMGCVLAWVYTTTKDIRCSMLTHMMWNLLSVI